MKDRIKTKIDPFTLLTGIFTVLVPTILLYVSVTFLFVATLGAGLIAIALSLSTPSLIKRCIGIGICVISIAGSFGLIAWNSSNGDPIKLIIPNDYVGEARIIIDEESKGLPVKEGDWLTYRLSDDASMTIHDDSPLYSWHSLRIEFRDGRVIYDTTKDVWQAHGYKHTRGGAISGGNEPGLVHYWEIEKIMPSD